MATSQEKVSLISRLDPIERHVADYDDGQTREELTQMLEAFRLSDMTAKGTSCSCLESFWGCPRLQIVG